MAAGLGFKDFTTGEVLTAADVDGYLMQGVWVFASAAARDAAVTSPQEGNFAYLKDTNVTTYYTGSAWANLDTTGMTNPMTTTGDIIYSSSGSTPARLGIGSTGNVLTVAGGVSSWDAPASGGMTLLSTTTLSGASTTISPISQSYKQLVFIIYGMTADTSNGQFYGALNNNTTANSMTGTQRGVATTSSGGKTVFTLNNTLRTDANNVWFFQVDNYTSTTNYKPTIMYGRYLENDSTNNYISMAGAFLSNTEVTSITFDYSGGNFTGGTVLTYGVS